MGCVCVYLTHKMGRKPILKAYLHTLDHNYVSALLLWFGLTLLACLRLCSLEKKREKKLHILSR